LAKSFAGDWALCNLTAACNVLLLASLFLDSNAAGTGRTGIDAVRCADATE